MYEMIKISMRLNTLTKARGKAYLAIKSTLEFIIEGKSRQSEPSLGRWIWAVFER